MIDAAPETLTFGCRLNIAESETMRRLASNAGLRDTVIVNTCAVTAEAERQAGQAIRRLKRERPGARVIVTGCASHIDPDKFAAMSEVDYVVANTAKLKAESYEALESRQGRESLSRLAGEGAERLREAGEGLAEIESRFDLLPQTPPHPPVAKGDGPLPLPQSRRGNPSLAAGTSLSALPSFQRAFVQVQNGCDHRCTFCIIPFGRGASRSLAAGDIIAQVRARVAEGFNEIVLTGVDIASYGRDLPGMPALGAMVKRLFRAAPELPRLRLSSLDPAAVDEDLWDLIAHEPRLMPHLHLSLQSGDDMILKRMKRRHSRDDIFRLTDRARRLRPGIVFGADIIAGFPTEADAMFQNTYDLAERCGFTWLHVFPYSARKGTPAARMPQVHGSLRKERAERLRALGDKAARDHRRNLIGKKMPVLVENNDIGCTPHFARLPVMGQAPVGAIVDADVVAGVKDEAVARV